MKNEDGSLIKRLSLGKDKNITKSGPTERPSGLKVMSSNVIRVNCWSNYSNLLLSDTLISKLSSQGHHKEILFPSLYGENI